MIFIKQCKGKDLNKVAKSKLDKGWYWSSKKYDGNYVQMHKFGNEVTFFSSGGIAFKLEDIEKQIVALNPYTDFILETEYIGTTNGMLGSRGKCTTTTFRTNTKKGIQNIDIGDVKFMVFDLLCYQNNLSAGRTKCPITLDFDYRMKIMQSLNYGSSLVPVIHKKQIFECAIDSAKDFVARGGEGLVIVKGTHIQKEGKRVNDRIKLKFYPTVMMECIDASYGTGQYSNVISSLELRDNYGTIVNVGGTYIGEMQVKHKSYFVGKLFRIEYESFDKTYVQPRFYKED